MAIEWNAPNKTLLLMRELIELGATASSVARAVVRIQAGASAGEAFRGIVMVEQPEPRQFELLDDDDLLIELHSALVAHASVGEPVATKGT